MNIMTEKEKLMNRLFGDPNMKLKNFKVFWGPKAHLITAEERAKVLNDAMDQVERGDCEFVDSFGDSNREQIEVKNFLDGTLPTKKVLK